MDSTSGQYSIFNLLLIVLTSKNLLSFIELARLSILAIAIEMMGIVSESGAWNLRVLLLLSPPGHTQPLSSTSKAPARAGEAEAPSPSGFTH